MLDNNNGRAELSRFAVDLVIRLALLAGIVYATLLLLRPIAGLLLWSVILAVAVFPLFAFLRRRLGLRPGVTAALLAVMLLALLVIPATVLGVSAVDTLETYARHLLSGNALLPRPPQSIQNWPMIGQRLYNFWEQAASDVRTLLSAHVSQIASLGRWIAGIAGSVALELLQFAAAIVVAGVLLSYSERLTASARRLATRVAGPRGGHFLEIAGATIRNVSQGVIGIALLQAALLGVGMLVMGIPFAGAITFACLVLAIVQIGPNIIMIPVVIWAWTEFPAFDATVYTIYTAPLLLVDNVLRPIVMSRGLQTPMSIILAGVICGTLVGGLIGLFIGPVLLAVSYDLVTAWLTAEPVSDVAATRGESQTPPPR